MSPEGHDYFNPNSPIIQGTNPIIPYTLDKGSLSGNYCTAGKSVALLVFVKPSPSK